MADTLLSDDRPPMGYARPARDASEAIWRRIEAEALEQVRADLAALALVSLTAGDRIAWAIQRFGRTDELSPIHRVGEPISGKDYTTCGELVPERLLWLPLGPGLLRTMPVCRYCEAEHVRLARGVAA